MTVKVVKSQNLQQKNFEKAVKDLSKIDDVAQIGWFENAKYPNGTPVAHVAITQEYGASTGKSIIPPRPFFKPALRENQSRYLDFLKRGIRRILKNEEDVKGLLEVIGGIVERDIKKSIKKVTSPPLAESTLRRRAARRKKKVEQLSNTGKKPLVDTGVLLGTVSHRIGKK